MFFNYQKIFNILSNDISGIYHSSLTKIKNDLFTNIGANLNLVNERSIAPFSTNSLKNAFKVLYNLKEIVSLNEVNFSLNNPINPSIKAHAEAEVNTDVKHLKKGKNKNFIPDAYLFSCDNLRMFVEYKIYNAANHYYNLASDFYKFKLYSNCSTKPLIFSYICFKRNGSGYPVLGLVKPNVKIKLISSTITKADISKDDDVFIYEQSSHTSRVDSDECQDLAILKDEINNVTDNKINNIYNDIINFKMHPYFKSKGHFGKNVITSNIIKLNYDAIHKIYDTFKDELDIQKLLSQIKNITNQPLDGIEPDEQLANWTSFYFNNNIRNIVEGNSRLSKGNKFIFSNSTRRSLYILLLIEKYAIDKNIDVRINYDDKEDRMKTDCAR